MADVRNPSERLLQLLSLLQTPREWPGTELAGRLGVTPRTIRRDVDRLRELGYPVDAVRGNVGGYRLSAGKAMPPLLLDDDEAIAVAISLRAAATSAVAGIEETSLRALTKLEQVIPVRLRPRVTALSKAAVALPRPEGPAVDADVLATLAAASLVHEKVRFSYTRADGGHSDRFVEPQQLVASGRLWYLVAFDPGQDAWRSFRLDRITNTARSGVRVPARELPGGVDTVTWVTRAIARTQVRATVVLLVPLDVARVKVPAWQGDLEAIGGASCRLLTPPDSLEFLAYRLMQLPVDYTLVDPPELRAHLAEAARRARSAIRRRPD